MTNMFWSVPRILLGVVILVLATSPLAATACSVTFDPKIQHNPETFIFEGRIVGFVADSTRRAWFEEFMVPDSVDFQQGEPAAGLLIEISNVTNAPYRAARYAVYPAGVGGGCEPLYWPRFRLDAEYEVGETVAVLAVSNEPDEANVPEVPSLIVWMLSRGVIIKAGAVGGEWGLEQWRDDFLYDSRLADAVRISNLEESRTWAYLDRMRFEYERDLKRLSDTLSDEERLRIVFKTRQYWYNVGSYLGERSDCGYAQLVSTYLGSQSLVNRLAGHIVLWGLRPLASEEACRAAVYVEQEEYRNQSDSN